MNQSNSMEDVISLVIKEALGEIEIGDEHVIENASAYEVGQYLKNLGFKFQRTHYDPYEDCGFFDYVRDNILIRIESNGFSKCVVVYGYCLDEEE